MTTNRWIVFVVLFAPIPFVVNYAMGQKAKWWQYALGLAASALLFAWLMPR
jgi:hypothetical protein